MYRYAQNQRVSILKAEMGRAYDAHARRIRDAGAAGEERLRLLREAYAAQIASMQQDRDRLCERHAETMRDIARSSASIREALALAYSRAQQAPGRE